MVRPRKPQGKILTPLQMTKRGIIRDAQRALINALILKGEATADDIRKVVTSPDWINPSIIGTAVWLLAREGIIVRVSTVLGQRPVAHSHLLRVWKLADREYGHAWLSTHQASIPVDTVTAGGPQQI